VRSMREHRRYLRGMFAWVGYDQTGVHYRRDARRRGKTKFPMRKMIAFATDGIVSFSAAPLRLALNIGFVVSVMSFLLGITTIVLKLADVDVVPGWASIAVAMTFLGGVQLTVLGVIGEYISRIYDEVKQRPLYLVRDWIATDPQDQVGAPRSQADDLAGAPPDRRPDEHGSAVRSELRSR
jgi:polyisoprenyl-phosphate glycosyltransferase